MDAVDSLYAAPGGLSPFTENVRGELVGCAPFASHTEAEVRDRIEDVPGLVVESGAIDVFLVAYRTAREPATVEGISTALVAVPERGFADRVPMVLAAHGTVGVADSCAPSKLVRDRNSFLSQDYFDAFYLAWAARGMPVVVPDYAGLGTPGVHDYSNWFDPARSAVDGLRALRSMLPADRLDGTVLVHGHSQGGGVALTVAAIADDIPELELGAVVATAPTWRTSTSIVDAVGLSSVGLTPILRAAAAFTGYAALANLTDDSSQHGAAFREEIRTQILDRVTGQCFGEALVALDTPAADYEPPATVGELLDPDFVAEVQACVGGGDCTTLGGRFAARDDTNEPHVSAESPHLLVTASVDDADATIGSIGCVADRIDADGAPLETCVHAGIDHLRMVPALTGYSIDWALAASRGEQKPACTGTEKRQACRLF